MIKKKKCKKIVILLLKKLKKKKCKSERVQKSPFPFLLLQLIFNAFSSPTFPLLLLPPNPPKKKEKILLVNAFCFKCNLIFSSRFYPFTEFTTGFDFLYFLRSIKSAVISKHSFFVSQLCIHSSSANSFSLLSFFIFLSLFRFAFALILLLLLISFFFL